VSDKLAIKNERSFYFADFTSRDKRRKRRFSRYGILKAVLRRSKSKG